MTKIISEIESSVWWTRRRKQKPQRECSIAKTGDASDLNRNREVFNLLRVPLPSLARKKRERIKKIKRNNNKNYSAQLKFQLSWKTTKILNWNQFFLMPVSVSSKKAGIRFRDFCRINCLDLPRWNETIIVVIKFYRRSVVMFGCFAVTNSRSLHVTNRWDNPQAVGIISEKFFGKRIKVSWLSCPLQRDFPIFGSFAFQMTH